MDDAKIERVRLVSRGYEVSADGRLSPAQFFRYLEHQRWSTIATSEKLPLRRFWAMGVVRAQVIELFTEVSFFTELELVMWMSRLGRTSSSFSHDIVRVADGALIGRNTATIVALDAARRPAVIDPSASRYVLQREAPEVERLDFEPPSSAWARSVEIRPSDHDLQQHVNQARYGDLVEDTRLLACRAGAYAGGSWDGPVRKLTITYEREARAGDPIRAVTWVSPGLERTLDFVLVRGDEVVTRARAVVG